MDAFLWWTGAIFWVIWLPLVAAALLRSAREAYAERRAQMLLAERLRSNGIDAAEAARMKNQWPRLFASKTTYDTGV